MERTERTRASRSVWLVTISLVTVVGTLGGIRAAFAAGSPPAQDARYVNEGQPDSITSEMITDGSISASDLAPGAIETAIIQNTTCPGIDENDHMIKVGPLCVDVYEASVWSLKSGDPRLAVQYAATNVDDYPCSDTGQDCTNIFARSEKGVTPSIGASWFQAQQACANSGKRLLTNAEWQMAAAGTPDDTTCNVSLGQSVPTGLLSGCVSNHGVYDMVGNLSEWVADWDEERPTCTQWPDFQATRDEVCFANDGINHRPGALRRGGGYFDGATAGVFTLRPSNPFNEGTNQVGTIPIVGFRCAR